MSAFSTPNGLNGWLCMPQGAASVPSCFVCVMLLTAALDMIQISLEDATGSDDSPINYVATLAAFLARLRPHKSFLKMVSVLTLTKVRPFLACLCLRTSNSSAACVMVLVTTSSPCLTRPGPYARLRPCSSLNRKRRLRSPCGTRSRVDP